MTGYNSTISPLDQGVTYHLANRLREQIPDLCVFAPTDLSVTTGCDSSAGIAALVLHSPDSRAAHAFPAPVGQLVTAPRHLPADLAPSVDDEMLAALQRIESQLAGTESPDPSDAT